MKPLHAFRTLLLAAGLPMAIASGAHAAGSCPDRVVAAVAKHHGDDAGAVVAPVDATCKRWPHDPRILLSAMVFDADEDDQKTLVVAMIDTATSRVIASYENTYVEDAVVRFGEGSVQLDTAPYQLSKDVRAFGIRFSTKAQGASCAGAKWHDELTLFVRDGKALRPVLKSVPMYTLVASEGCFGPMETGLVYDEALLTVGIAAGASYGFADLAIDARIKHGAYEGPAVPAGVQHTVLHYDGKAYVIGKHPPWWLKQFPEDP